MISKYHLWLCLGEQRISSTKIKQKWICQMNLMGFLAIIFAEAVARYCPVKKVFLRISQNSQENACARASFSIKLQANRWCSHGLPIGSNFGFSVILSHFEEQWMFGCPIEYKPFSYKRYSAEAFSLFSSELHVTKFSNYMNSKQNYFL